MSGFTPFTSLAVRSLLGGCLALLPLAGQSEALNLPTSGDLVGKMRYVKAHQGDTLIDIAHRYSVGQDEIVLANPTESRYYWVPGEGTQVLIPDHFILPDAPRVGIVVNIPEMRLYFFPPGENQLWTYPISIGRMDWKSPLGLTKIVEKIKDPTWTPPESIKKEHALDGEILPDVVPAGPDNPLGRFAMRLGVKGSYLIHGTGQNKADGIGMMVTHGCMRMYPEDVEQLFPKVSMGTQVNLVNQPVKVGLQGNVLYVEVSQPLDEDHPSTAEYLSQARALIQKKVVDHPELMVNEAALKLAVKKANGIPSPISGDPAAAFLASQQKQQQQSQPVPAEPSAPAVAPAPRPVVTAPPPPAAPPVAPYRPRPEPSAGATSIPPAPVARPNPVITPPTLSPPKTYKPAPVDAQPGPVLRPSSAKPEHQLLPPIY